MSNNISIVIPFSQNYVSNPTFTSDTSAGLTGHILPWNLAGSTSDVWLYNYDKNGQQWWLNLLNSDLENEVGATNSLKYLVKTNETYNLKNFVCQTITVRLHHELNQYYLLDNLIIATTNSTGGQTISTKYSYHDMNGNDYYFNINSNISIGNTSPSIEDSFSFVLSPRPSGQPNLSKVLVRNDPRATELIKLTIHGYSESYNEFNIGSSGSIDFREYSKLLIIKDDTEHGYLRYDSITEKYRFVHGGTTFTNYEFNIVDSSLYKIKIQGLNVNNLVTVPELKIRGGKLVANISETNKDNVIVEYCELYLHDSEIIKVPMKNNILILTKTEA